MKKISREETVNVVSGNSNEGEWLRKGLTFHCNGKSLYRFKGLFVISRFVVVLFLSTGLGEANLFLSSLLLSSDTTSG